MSDFSERDPLIFSTSNGPSGLRTEQHDSKWLNGNKSYFKQYIGHVLILHVLSGYIKNGIENWKRKQNKFTFLYFFSSPNVIFSTVKVIVLHFPYLF